MITITQSATQHIQNILKNKPENSVFRLSIKKTGCSVYQYVPEIAPEKKDTDTVFAISNLIIYLDANTVPLMQGTVIDYVQKSLGVSQLVFTHPEAQSVCGCGESFMLKNDNAK